MKLTFYIRTKEKVFFPKKLKSCSNNCCRKFEERWEEIRDEALGILQSQNKTGSFKDEAENLRDRGVWQQLELYARGEKLHIIFLVFLN